MPSTEELYRELRGAGLVMLTVNLGEDAEAVRMFMQEQGLSSQALLDSGTTAAYYGAYGIAVTCVIDRRGRVAARTIGSRHWTSEGSSSLIRSLLLE